LLCGAFVARTPTSLCPTSADRNQSAAHQLGRVSLPKEAGENVDAVKTAIKLASVDTFRVVMIIARIGGISAIWRRSCRVGGQVAKPHQ